MVYLNPSASASSNSIIYEWGTLYRFIKEMGFYYALNIQEIKKISNKSFIWSFLPSEVAPWKTLIEGTLTLVDTLPSITSSKYIDIWHMLTKQLYKQIKELMMHSDLCSYTLIVFWWQSKYIKIINHWFAWSIAKFSNEFANVIHLLLNGCLAWWQGHRTIIIC